MSRNPSSAEVLLAAIRVLGLNARKSISSGSSPIQYLLALTTSRSRLQNLMTSSYVVLASQEVLFVSIINPNPLSFPQAIMRTCHLILWLLAGSLFGVVSVDSETQSGSDVIDNAEGVVGGKVTEAGELFSVSPPLQFLRVPRSGGRKADERTRLTS